VYDLWLQVRLNVAVYALASQTLDGLLVSLSLLL
jgi:hypothetical protein